MVTVNITAKLEQLSCPECGNLIAGVVGRIKGVEGAEVRYTTSKLLVTYDDAKTDWETIQTAVAKLGYQVLSHKRM